MKIAIMQPYFLPYIGYFQLIAAVDRFVIYDTVQYTKKGWVNRNRLLRNDQAVTFTLPLKKASDFADICQREVAADFDRGKLVRQFAQAYRTAPQFGRVMPLLQDILACPEPNLFQFIQYSLTRCCAFLKIATPILVASQIEAPKPGKAVDRVLGICKSLGADRYINPVGGLDLYIPAAFRAQGLDLRFLKSRVTDYSQFGAAFQPALSIIDVMMFNSPDRIADLLTQDYDLIEGREAPDVSLA